MRIGLPVAAADPAKAGIGESAENSMETRMTIEAAIIRPQRRDGSRKQRVIASRTALILLLRNRNWISRRLDTTSFDNSFTTIKIRALWSARPERRATANGCFGSHQRQKSTALLCAETGRRRRAREDRRCGPSRDERAQPAAVAVRRGAEPGHPARTRRAVRDR